MQEIYAKTCRPVFRDLLDIHQLTIAYHRPKNLHDLLMPSKLRTCNGKENQVETYLAEAGLSEIVEEINYDEMRKDIIKDE